MKRVTSICFALLLTAPLLTKFTLVTTYLFQYDYYVNVLCENIEKKELKCNGTCHLAKELKAVDTSESNPELPVEVKADPVFFFQEQEPDQINLSVFDESFYGSTDPFYNSPDLGLNIPPPKV